MLGQIRSHRQAVGGSEDQGTSGTDQGESVCMCRQVTELEKDLALLATAAASFATNPP